MNRESSERRLVAQLSAAMASKLALPRNRAKGGWNKSSRVELLDALQCEFRELCEAVLNADCDDPADVANIEQEAADVGNVAGMVLDCARNYWGKR